MTAPAALLREAAARLRSDAGRATAGPWRCEQGSDEAPGIGAYQWWAVTDADDANVASVTIRSADQGNAEWIALVSPAIAEPLAAWLDAEARSFDLPIVPADSTVRERSPQYRLALALLGRDEP